MILLINENFIVTLAIMVFIGLLFKKVHFLTQEFIAVKTKQIKNQMEQAKLLKQEALFILEQQTKLKAENAQKTQKMLEDTKRELLFERERSLNELEQKLKNKLQIIAQQMDINKYNLAQRLREKSISLAISTVVEILDSEDLKKLDNILKQKLFSQITSL